MSARSDSGVQHIAHAAEFNKKGFLPSIDDATAEAFLKRAEVTLSHIQNKQSQNEKNYFIETINVAQASLSNHKSIKNIIEENLQVQIKHVLVSLSATSLFPWEAACCWLEEYVFENIETKCNQLMVIATIQIRSKYIQNHSGVWPLLSEFIVYHEYIHAFRAPLRSKKYEELVAYYIASQLVAPTTSIALRSFLGPLFTSPFEICLWLIGSMTFSLASVLYDLPIYIAITLPAIWISIPICLLLPFFVRLVLRWSMLKKLENFFRQDMDKQQWLSFLLRLSDTDIVFFLKKVQACGRRKTKGRVYDICTAEKKDDWRLRFLLNQYL